MHDTDPPEAQAARTGYQDIIYEVEDRTAVITLNRPERLNALSPVTVRELRSAYAAAEADDAVWTILVTGVGRAFCTGADVGEIPDDGRVVYDEPYLSTFEQWEAPQEGTPPFRSMTKPVITAVNGLCCGAGLDWVTTGDITIASDRAEFFDPHVSIGLVVGPRDGAAGPGPADGHRDALALTGRHERMSAQRAYDLGLVSEVVEHDQLLARAKEIAALVNRNAPLAVRGTRLAIRKGLDLPLHEAEILAEAFRERVRADRRREGGPGGLHGEASTGVDGLMNAESMSFETIRYETSPDKVATITLNRPEVLNAFDRQMCEEVRAARGISSSTIPASTRSSCGAAGDRAFSAGLDVHSDYGQPEDVWNHGDPGELLSPKWQQVWKPVVCAVRRNLFRRCLLLSQRGGYRHLFPRGNLLRLARQPRIRLRSRARGADAAHWAW